MTPQPTPIPAPWSWSRRHRLPPRWLNRGVRFGVDCSRETAQAGSHKAGQGAGGGTKLRTSAFAQPQSLPFASSSMPRGRVATGMPLQPTIPLVVARKLCTLRVRRVGPDAAGVGSPSGVEDLAAARRTARPAGPVSGVAALTSPFQCRGEHNPARACLKHRGEALESFARACTTGKTR